MFLSAFFPQHPLYQLKRTLFYLLQSCYDSAAHHGNGGLSGGCRSESLDCLNEEDGMYTVGCTPDDDTCYVLHCCQGSLCNQDIPKLIEQDRRHVGPRSDGVRVNRSVVTMVVASLLAFM